jgi:hypothetical protein
LTWKTYLRVVRERERSASNCAKKGARRKRERERGGRGRG